MKEAVNHNADEMTTMQNSISSINRSMSAMSESMTSLREDVHITKVSKTDTNVTILPGKMYVWGRVNGLTVTLGAGTEGIVNEYMMQFTVGSSLFALTLSPSVKWVEEPDWEVGYVYQVSIEDGLAVAAGWEA